MRGERALDPLDPALDLERHAHHAIVVGLVLAAFIHAVAVAHTLLTPLAPRRPALPVQFDEFDIGLFTPAAPASAPSFVPDPAPAVAHAAVKTEPVRPSPEAQIVSARREKAQPPPEPEPAPTPVPEPAAVASATVPVLRVTRAPDRSSPARLGGSVRWLCPWPKEAEAEMRHMTVQIAADVRADGAPQSIRVMTDPGYGFGAAAQACAMRHTYVPSRDSAGREADGATMPFAVHFDR